MFLDYDSPHVGMTGQHALELEQSDLLESTLTLLDDNNENLNKHAKELLLWHYCLGHLGFTWLQSLMRTRRGHDGPEKKNQIREEESNYLYYNYQLLSYLGL